MDFDDEKTIVTASMSGQRAMSEAEASSDSDTLNDDVTLLDADTKAPMRRTSYESEPILAEIDRYLVLKRLGAGASGAVYLAKDRETDALFAVKGMLTAAADSRTDALKGNYRLTQNLTHEHIAVIKDWHPIEFASYRDGATAADLKVKSGDALLVMQYAEGRSLGAWRLGFNDGVVDPVNALAVLHQLADALDYVHEQGVIHRDVKPANIKVLARENGTLCVKLFDFGIAVEGGATGRAGTETYWSPEQKNGQEQTAAADQYALAVVGRELLTGSPKGDFDSRLDWPEREVLQRALADDPAGRYGSCIEFVDELEIALKEGGVKLPPEYRELKRTYDSDEMDASAKFDAYADSLDQCARDTLMIRKVTTQFTNSWDVYRFLFTDAKLLKRVDRLRSRRSRRRKNPSSVTIDEVRSRAAFKAACEGVAYLTGKPIPDVLREVCDSIVEPPDPPAKERPAGLKSITLSITRIEEPFFFACDVDADDAEEELKVDPLQCGVPFAEFKRVFNPGDKVLITNPIITGDTWQGSELVLEPDFLLSPQALGRAHVWGQGSLMYLLSTFSREWKAASGADENSKPPKYRLMLGNLGDDCLAEEVAGGNEPQAALSQQFIQSNALDATAHEIDAAWKEEAEFIRKNISREIRQNLPAEFGVAPDQWQIEAPFISPFLGVAGRMDAFAPYAATENRSVVFELKSGKWKIFRDHDPKDEHLFQPWIYGDMLYYALGIGRKDVWPRLYYSKRVKDKNNNIYNGHSFAVTADREKIRLVMNFRNKVVNVWKLMRDNKLRKFFESGKIRSDSFRAPSCGDKLWDVWLKPQAEALVNPILSADPLARDYFWRFLAFEAAEDFCAWCGEGEQSGGKSLSWKMALPEKRQAGMVLSGLVPVSHRPDEKGRIERIDFDHTLEPTNAFCSIRPGDSVFIYEQASDLSNPSNTRVFGGHIASFEDREHNPQLRIMLDPPQTPAAFPVDASKQYIVEASLGNRGKNEYKGLFMFLSGCPRRRQLLLNQIQPYCDPVRPIVGRETGTPVGDLIARAWAARDWYLVWGPPGTGKTSHFLRGYVEQVVATPAENVLMLAYTNRAVDEICGMLEAARRDAPAEEKAKWDYWRIGTASHCAADYQSHLPESRGLGDRQSVLEGLDKIKIVVGTIASLSADHSVLHLGKRFDSAIVDEASQILEPQLLSLFCAPDDGAPREPLIGKFVLVGDDKQLPAVVLQSVETSAVSEESLRTIHLTNCRHSLFMRLKELSGQKPELFGKMGKQFRMHEDIAKFPNKYFYDNLGVGDVVRQCAPLPPAPFRATSFEKYVLSTRLGFFQVITPEISKNAKSNDAEAYVCASAVKVLLEKGSKYGEDTGHVPLMPSDIGIIAPFRSQIATIRSRLKSMLPENVPVAQIMIDTVERYQGSERPVIIFSAVVSKKSQFNALCPTEDEERTIESDKKLNVALTRAKEQFFLIGHRELLAQMPSYKALIEMMESEYGTHYPKEPLAEYAAMREAELAALTGTSSSGVEVASESVQQVAEQQTERNLPVVSKKPSLWGRFLKFMGIR